MTTLQIENENDGEPVPMLMIADHRDVSRKYPVAPFIVRGAAFACQLFTVGDACYTVACGVNGEWTCTCKDYICRMKRYDGEHCKHTAAVSQFYDALEAFFFGIERLREVRAILRIKQKESA